MHCCLDRVNLFEPASRYATQIRAPEAVPEVVHKASKDALAEKAGGCFIDFPERHPDAEVDPNCVLLRVLVCIPKIVSKNTGGVMCAPVP